MVALYDLEHNYHSGDYTETQNTVIFVTDCNMLADSSEIECIWGNGSVRAIE
jgi:hypothetical protein